jgi:hypothetical protein
MKANAAVAMALCGAALALLSLAGGSRSIRVAATAAAAMVIALGALTLAEDISGHDLGLDQWLFPDVATRRKLRFRAGCRRPPPFASR